MSGTRPADFRVELTWYSPPLPPPHGWCARTRIGADPVGTLQVEADGGAPDGGTWTERFPLYASHLDWLYGALVHEELFTRSWQVRRDIPVGGGGQTLIVTANGRETHVPAYVIDEQEPAARGCRDAVEALVPPTLRDALDAKRQRYVRARR